MVLKERDYSQGKIYRIYSNICNIVYIGSTTEKYLCNRKKTHIYKFRKWDQDQVKNAWTSSFDLLRLPHHEFDLIESYPCNSVDELRRRERYWLEKYQEDPKLVVVNRNTPGRQQAEYSLEKVNCECGCQCCRGNLVRHKRTRRHKDQLDKEEKNLNIL